MPPEWYLKDRDELSRWLPEHYLRNLWSMTFRAQTFILIG